MPAPRKDVIAKYLERYAEPEAAFGLRLKRRTDHVVVVPVQDETPSFLEGFQDALSAVRARGNRVLCIIVVNATDAHAAGVHARNESLLSTLKTHAQAVPLHGPDETPCWYSETDGFDLVVLDRNGKGYRLPRHEGVGLARKIGCDLALVALRAGWCRSQLIHMTDCDVRLPTDYFDVKPPESSAAMVYAFVHEPCGQPAIDEAHACYEAYLRYYILGLRYAGSGYDFHTIGSCIATQPATYAGVRGVPKRQAGEDFYLLNKIAKLGPIHTVVGSPITIRARTSLRVPFGTGRATHEIAQNVDAYRIYDPRIFELLKVWLAALVAFDDAPSARAYDTVCRRASATLGSSDRDRLATALSAIDAPKALSEAAAQSKVVGVRRKWTYDWFDAFRTLKFLHALRDTGLVDVPWRQAIANAPFCRSVNLSGTATEVKKTEAFDICRQLARLEER